MAERRKLILHDRGGRAPSTAEPWKVLVVDDDDQVHAMTRVILRDLEFDGRPFACIEASSAAEAAAALEADPDIPVVLLDVVMETPDAGLRLVRHIREDLDNRRIRIILRTGQPGEAPERDVVQTYDVNDYRSKVDLTAQKLFTALAGALRAWRDINTIHSLNSELSALNASLEQRVAERTRQLEESTEALSRAKDGAELALSRETEAKRQLHQFLSMVSHEFRTPLAIIDSSAQMLRMRAESYDPDAIPRLTTIRGGVQRLIGLIDTCLADEQLESGRIILDEQPFHLGPVLSAAINHHRTVSPDRFIDLDMGDLPPVWGDARMLSLVFSNLVGNAIKYSPDGLPVAIKAHRLGAEVTVSVSDRGIGIPPEDLPTIFERFHRAANVKGIPGSGIGLHMVRQIVEMHGSTVTATSRLGEGSCFTVRLRTAPGEQLPVRWPIASAREKMTP
jgi:signal transduction histidine kinase